MLLTVAGRAVAVLASRPPERPQIRVPTGQVLLTQGDAARYFFVIEKGLVSFVVDGDELAAKRMGEGESFGELALLYRGAVTATARAEATCVLWRVDEFHFRESLDSETLEAVTLHSAPFAKLPQYPWPWGPPGGAGEHTSPRSVSVM